MRAKAVFASVSMRVVDLLLPPRCLSCGAAVARQGGVCARCWNALTFLGAPWCVCCGFPFELPPVEGDAARCGACLAEPPPFDRARSALRYDDGSKPLILGFKHADRTWAALPLGTWLARAGGELLAGADLIAPVPLHRWRLFARRYNQSALLALAVGRASGIAVCPNLLVRRRHTPTQGGLSRAGRRRNVAGAIALRPRHREAVSGRSVLLIDDVLTTGATVGECARVLKRAGAGRVDVLTLARVL